jgi:MFS family permease
LTQWSRVVQGAESPPDLAAETLEGRPKTQSDPARDGPFVQGRHARAAHALDGQDSRWGVLRHFHYRNVLFAQVFSNIGTWTEMFAIQMYVAHKTGRLDDQGTLGVCQQLPIFFLGIFGGLAADRVNRRTLLVVTQLMAGVVAIGVALIATYESALSERTAIHLLFLLGILNGCVMAFNFPAWQVLTPRLVPRDELTQAVTVNGIQFNFARVIGPAIAGLVLAKWGPPPLLWFNSFTFILMALVVMTTPDDPAPPPTGHRISKQIHDAWSFLIHNRGPRAVFFAQISLCLLAAPMVRMISNFVIDVYPLSKDVPAIVKAFGMKDMTEFVGGTLLAVQGVGAVTGGLCIKFVPRWYPKHHFIPLSVAALGLAISCFATCRIVWLGYVCMLVVGWFWMWAFNQSWAMIQVLTPDHLRGRAMSITNVCVFGAMALGAWIAGFGGEQLKVRGILDAASATQASILMLSVPLFCAGVFMMVYRTPEVDGMPRVKGDRRARSLLYAITAGEHRPRPGESAPEAKVEAIQEQEPV